jgi:antitoxin (DNA-binding transcriptional repressor) of toxin-antitoxin stability system
MRRITADELREHLDDYLARVRAGEVVLVCDEGEAPVQLAATAENGHGAEEPRTHIPPAKPLPLGWLDNLEKYRVKPLKPVDVDKILDEMRADRF